MTNYIKKLISAVLLAGMVSVTPVLADECKLATQAEVQEAITHVEGAQHRMLTPSEVQVLVDAKGAPPNAAEDSTLEMELVYNDNIAAINVYQDGCYINKLGPTLKQTIYDLLGLVDA